MKTGENVLQNGLQPLRKPGIQCFFRHQWVLRILLCQHPQQIGQTGADRHLAAEQLHAVSRARFQRQMITLQMLAHLCHIVLQRRATDKPFISQIFQLR